MGMKGEYSGQDTQILPNGFLPKILFLLGFLVRPHTLSTLFYNYNQWNQGAENVPILKNLVHTMVLENFGMEIINTLSTRPEYLPLMGTREEKVKITCFEVWGREDKTFYAQINNAKISTKISKICSSITVIYVQ